VSPAVNGRHFARQGGFTLLEMLVVVTVLGFLVIGLTQGVRTGLTLWEAQSRRVGETADLDAAARILRALLSGIAPSPSFGPAAGGAAAGGAAAGGAELKGSSTSLAFVGDLPTGLGTTQRADITLELSHGRLVLRWTPHRHELSTAAASPPAETELVGNVERLDLAYWGTSPSGQETGWQAQWDGPAIPELIRVRLVFGEKDRRRFPDLIAAPQS
jgi:general secretion pathway protein J